MCGNVETKETNVDKWLGQLISSKGLADSVLKTIESKEGKVKGACLEIATIVEDWRSQVVGGMESALTMWEACCIPTLLSGAGTWTEIQPAAERRLDALQNWFVRLILRVGPGCPAASLRWETGLLGMGLRVWVEKVMLVRHLRGLDTDALARKVYEEQKQKDWPGLAKETARICQELQIPDCNEADIWGMSTKEYRRMVTGRCKEVDMVRMMEEAGTSQKCARIMKEPYGKKPYMTKHLMAKVRQIFMTRVKMQPFAGNFPKDKRFSKTNWKCRCNLEIEQEEHLLSGVCPVYGDLLSLVGDERDDMSLLTVFTAILARRGRMEEEDVRRSKQPVVAGYEATDSASPAKGRAST